MRIFCPATLLLPRSCFVLRPARARALRFVSAGVAAAVYLSEVHRSPRSGVSPARILRLDGNPPLSKLAPDAPVWAPVVCPARRKPGSEQPDQYALSRGLLQIPGLGIGALAWRPWDHRSRSSFLLRSKVARHGRSNRHYQLWAQRPLTPKLRADRVSRLKVKWLVQCGYAA